MPKQKILTLLVFVGATCSAQEHSLVQLSDESVRALRQSVEIFRQSSGTAGIAIAVTTRDRMVYFAADGFADVERRIAVTEVTPFPLASISKTFTAVAILRMHEADKIALDKPLLHYLPWLEIRTQFRPFTVYEVLTHTAGLPA